MSKPIGARRGSAGGRRRAAVAAQLPEIQRYLKIRTM